MSVITHNYQVCEWVREALNAAFLPRCALKCDSFALKNHFIVLVTGFPPYLSQHFILLQVYHKILPLGLLKSKRKTDDDDDYYAATRHKWCQQTVPFQSTTNTRRENNKHVECCLNHYNTNVNTLLNNCNCYVDMRSCAIEGLQWPMSSMTLIQPLFVVDIHIILKY